jgi:hypothetical protein
MFEKLLEDLIKKMAEKAQEKLPNSKPLKVR